MALDPRELERFLPNVAEPAARSDLARRLDALERRAGAVPLVTAPPASPHDGQRVDLLVDATEGIVWPLRYRAAAPNSKWEVLGGAPVKGLSTGGFATMTTTGQTAGMPTATVPRTGAYRLRWGFYFQEVAGNAGFNRARATAWNLTTGAGFAQAANITLGGIGYARGAIVGEDNIRSHTAGNVLTVRYWQDAGTPTFAPLELAWIELQPIRIFD